MPADIFFLHCDTIPRIKAAIKILFFFPEFGIYKGKAIPLQGWTGP
jgi:hypothetical protein